MASSSPCCDLPAEAAHVLGSPHGLGGEEETLSCAQPVQISSADKPQSQLKEMGVAFRVFKGADGCFLSAFFPPRVFCRGVQTSAILLAEIWEKKIASHQAGFKTG